MEKPIDSPQFRRAIDCAREIAADHGTDVRTDHLMQALADMEEDRVQDEILRELAKNSKIIPQHETSLEFQLDALEKAIGELRKHSVAQQERLDDMDASIIAIAGHQIHYDKPPEGPTVNDTALPDAPTVRKAKAEERRRQTYWEMYEALKRAVEMIAKPTDSRQRGATIEVFNRLIADAEEAGNA